jgi:cytohesin
VNSTDKSGKTALMAAAAIGDAEVVKMLLNYGADVNHRDRLGTTALDHAHQGGHRDVVNLLVANDRGRAPSDASIREVQWL